MKLRKIIWIGLVLFLLSLGFSFAAMDNLLSKPAGSEVNTENDNRSNNKNNSNKDQFKEAQKKPGISKNMNILLVGIDAGVFPGGGVRKEKGRTDTIILVQFDAEKQKVHALSIPRDTLVEIPGRGQDKVNHAYAFGDMELTIETLENFLSLTIDKYVKLDYQGFAYLIDAVGGVEMDVEKDIQSGRYLIKKGRQILDGEHAYALIRHRKEPLGDIARVQRQQQMAKALFRQIKEKQNLLEISLMALKFKEHITTDLSIKDMIWLINTVKKLDEKDIELKTLPGTFYEWKGICYWKPDMERK
ncbi:MAG: LCP family protein [Bacillota bacterium]|jgi:LCP family protein required for cell wall assembly